MQFATICRNLHVLHGEIFEHWGSNPQYNTTSTAWPATQPHLNISSTKPILVSVSLNWLVLNIHEELLSSSVKKILGVQAGEMKTSQKQTPAGRYLYSSHPWNNSKKLLETLFFATVWKCDSNVSQMTLSILGLKNSSNLVSMRMYHKLKRHIMFLFLSKSFLPIKGLKRLANAETTILCKLISFGKRE